MLITGVTFSLGITTNPTFNINDFFANLSSEIIGWILAVTIFQYYYNVKMEAKNSKKEVGNSLSIADEILKLKNLLDNGVITQEEFENAKNQFFKK